MASLFGRRFLTALMLIALFIGGYGAVKYLLTGRLLPVLPSAHSHAADPVHTTLSTKQVGPVNSWHNLGSYPSSVTIPAVTQVEKVNTSDYLPTVDAALISSSLPAVSAAKRASYARLADSRITVGKAGNNDGQSTFLHVFWSQDIVRWAKAHALEILLGFGLILVSWRNYSGRRRGRLLREIVFDFLKSTGWSDFEVAGRQISHWRLNENALTDAKRIIQTWLDKQGHDRCWYYPDLFRELATLFGLEQTDAKSLPPLAEFQEGCRRYQAEEYASDTGCTRCAASAPTRCALCTAREASKTETQVSEGEFVSFKPEDITQFREHGTGPCTAVHKEREAKALAQEACRLLIKADISTDATESKSLKTTALEFQKRANQANREAFDLRGSVGGFTPPTTPAEPSVAKFEAWERYSRLYPQQAFELRVECDAACRKPGGTLDVERANAQISEGAKLALARLDKLAECVEAEKRGTLDPC